MRNSRNFPRHQRKAAFGILSVLLAIAPLSQAAMLMIDITNSNYIRSAAQADTVQGSGNAVSNLFGDISGANDDIRAIFAVPLTHPDLAGVTIDGATLKLKVSALDGGAGGSVSNVETIQLFQLTQPFAENEATWNRASAGNSWSGGAFNGGSVLATLNANPATATLGQALDLTSSNLASLVQGSIGGTLYFIVKFENEDNVDRSLFRVGSDDNSNVAYRPQFEIQYTIPEPSIFSMLGGMGCLMFFRRTRPGFHRPFLP